MQTSLLIKCLFPSQIDLLKLKISLLEPKKCSCTQGYLLLGWQQVWLQVHVKLRLSIVHRESSLKNQLQASN